jgi:sugar lactone lactonase YvrE
MSNRKTIVQVYSGNEPLGFNDFVRGTLRLLNFTIDRNIDLKINIEGSDFEQYLNVTNYRYNPELYKPIVYLSNNTDLIYNLSEFVNSSNTIYVITSAVYIDRSKIYNTSYYKFISLVEFKNTIYTSANTLVRNSLLHKRVSNLDNGYNVIYVNRDMSKTLTNRDMFTLISQINNFVNCNTDTILMSNSSVLKNKLYTHFESVQIDDSIIDMTNRSDYTNLEDSIIDFVILLKAKKIYRFTDTINTSDNIYNTALDMQSMIGNLNYTSNPLTYRTSTLVSFLNSPSGIVSDKDGNLYISDTMNHRICKRTPDGVLTTFAGSLGNPGFVDGSTRRSRFNLPSALAIDTLGNIYIADTGNNAIRIISNTTNLIVGTIVNPIYGLQSPRGVAVDIYGSVYISDTGNNRICMIISKGECITLAGGSRGYLNETGINAQFDSPTAIAVDSNKNLYVADTGNHSIRKITKDKVVTTIAGNGVASYIDGTGTQAGFNTPTGLTIDTNGVIYVSDTGNHTIRRITPNNKVISLLGRAINGYGSVNSGGNIGVCIKNPPSFYAPSGISFHSSAIFIADRNNNMIRKIQLDSFFIKDVMAVPIQTIKIIESHGVAMNLGPTLSAPPPNPNTIVYGTHRGK